MKKAVINIEEAHPALPTPIIIKSPEIVEKEDYVCVRKDDFKTIYNNRLEIIRNVEQTNNIIKHYREN